MPAEVRASIAHRPAGIIAARGDLFARVSREHEAASGALGVVREVLQGNSKVSPNFEATKARMAAMSGVGPAWSPTPHGSPLKNPPLSSRAP